MTALETAHPELQAVAHELIKRIDFSVSDGHRSDEEQERLYHAGLTKKRAGQSLHNRTPSDAIHFNPWPIDWKDTRRFYWLAGQAVELGRSLGVPLRYGGDWDRDGDITDQTFLDLAHFERWRADRLRLINGVS